MQDLDFLNIEGVLVEISSMSYEMRKLCLKSNLSYNRSSLDSIYARLLEISKELEDVYVCFPNSSN